MNTPQATGETVSLAPPGPMRWRWYHYYFLLAVVDLVVIVASLLLYHQTLTSYEIALHKLTRMHTKQRWVANLQLLVVRLNAPGNDVFESRQVRAERARFEQNRDALNSELKRAFELDVDLTEFRGHLDKMIDEERRIFDALEPLADAPDDRTMEPLEEATKAMAAMDRHQAAAVTSMTEVEQELLMRVESLLREHGAFMSWCAVFENLFAGVVVVILGAMFWYGRKLQRMHERMIADQETATIERTRRLAAVGEVCAAVAHGIRNPLAAISSSAQLGLSHGSADENTRSRLQDILAECKRLDQRVTRLIGFARTVSLAPKPFSLREVVDQAVQELRPILDERNITLAVVFELDAVLQGDHERMTQCVIELLSNSLQYTPHGGRIDITCAECTERSGFVDLYVTDTGPGIPPDVMDRVFDLFFSTRPGGTGIGLASVKHTVHGHGGEVMAVPNAGNGTRIRLTLPLQEEADRLVRGKMR